MVMALQIPASTCLCSSPTTTKSHLLYFKSVKYQFAPGIPRLGLSYFSPYIGLRHLGVSISPKSIKLVTNKRCRCGVVRASLFGVGAPEALVIGVVALLVFGPKGLAEVARNLGKTLRAFQPTIRELQDVSREFKGTLEREIGLDEFSAPGTSRSYGPKPTPAPPSTPPGAGDPGNMADPNGAPSSKPAYATEEYLKITEEQLKAAAAQQSEATSRPKENKAEAQTDPES